MKKLKASSICCNPLNIPKHRPCLSDLRPVLPWMIEKCPSITLNNKICSKCRKRLKELPSTSQQALDIALEEEAEVMTFEEPQPVEEEVFVDKNMVLKSLNDCLSHLGESPFDTKKIDRPHYVKRKLKNLVENLCNKVFNIEYESDDEEHKTNDELFIEKLKEKYAHTSDKDLKCMILTLLPENWSINKIVKEFPNASLYMARKCKELQRTQGVLSSYTRKQRSMDASSKELVENFYNSDEVSRIMPGKKDYVSMWVGDRKEHVQKRLVLANLKEIYRDFKEKHTDLKIGFSTFATLRPKNCILAGSHGTHSTCVCRIHQNIKLMLEGCKISNLTKEEAIHIDGYKTCIARSLCNPPNIPCFFGNCNECPGYSDLKEILKNTFEKNCVETVTYRQWTATDRSQLNVIIESAEDFIECLTSKMPALREHSFITDQQNKYFQHVKSSLECGDILVVLDFSENFSFVIQDEVQGYHWSNDQATIHPFGIFFRNAETSDLDQTNLIIISDCLKHNFISVSLFQKELIKFLKTRFSTIRKIYYFSDGSAAQYKNKKNFYNLTLHKTEFKIDVEWNFFSTSHGKSVCDGLGGTLKRLATKASLQRPFNDQITTPELLFKWATDNITNMNFVFIAEELYSKEESSKMHMPLKLTPLPMTRKMHQIVPVEKGKIKAKQFSFSSNEVVHKLD